MTHYFYERLPDMHILAGSASEEITLEFEEGVLDSEATMTAQLARAEAPDAYVTGVSCTKSGDTFNLTLGANVTKNLHGVYNMDFVLTNGSVTKKVARGQLVVEFSPTVSQG